VIDGKEHSVQVFEPHGDALKRIEKELVEQGEGEKPQYPEPVADVVFPECLQLNRKGRAAFQKLCALMHSHIGDPDQFDWRFAEFVFMLGMWFPLPDTIVLPSLREVLEAENPELLSSLEKDKSSPVGRRLDLARSLPTGLLARPLDKWQTALEVAGEGRVLKKKELEQVAECARVLRQYIPLLRKTPAVRELAEQGKIGTHDLLYPGGALGLRPAPSQLDSLINLPGMIREFGPQHDPDRVRILTELIDFVRKHTGNYHDRLLENVLGLKNLKMWRSRHGLTNSTN
jgi:hypothetical protein